MPKARLLKPSLKHHFFLFGARGTGKSTLLHQIFAETAYWINLLLPEEEARFSRDPSILMNIVKNLPEMITHIVIDEVQKVPKLLDVIHALIEEKGRVVFVMTGSSARKLKRGAANLLAGRAFVYHLYPFSFMELGEDFNLEQTLQYGLLPKLFELATSEEKTQFLQAYTHTYLKEEVMTEQLIKNLDPFRRFLEVAAQMNGKVINTHNIAREVGVDDKTVNNYFSILEDTLLGFMLEPFHHSFRKRLGRQPKFYFFDGGIARALQRTLTLPTQAQTSYYGDLFEAFVITEIYKLCQYFKSEYRLSFIRTKDDMEIDLVVERPGAPLLLIEIKSTASLRADQTHILQRVAKELNAEAWVLSQDPLSLQFENVLAMPWKMGLSKFGIA